MQRIPLVQSKMKPIPRRIELGNPTNSYQNKGFQHLDNQKLLIQNRSTSRQPCSNPLTWNSELIYLSVVLALNTDLHVNPAIACFKSVT